MNEIENIKNELISLYKSLKNDLPEDTFSSFSFEQGIVDISKNFSPISLIQKIKEIVNNNNKNIEINEELLNNYSQLESQIKKNEFDIKYYISELMASKIKIISLQIKLNAYITIENELEELKAKIKYGDGKFLENDRKDNEILILRKENTKIKKQLSKKINELETKVKQNENKTRNVRINNITIHSSTSKHDLKSKTNDMDNNIFYKWDNQKYKTIKYMRNKNYQKNNSDMNYLSSIYSPNCEYYLFENNNKSTNNKIFDSTYNNMLNSFNKKIKLPLKRDFSNFMKQKKSNSVSRILNYENDGDKNILNISHKKRKNLINTTKAGSKKKFLIKSTKM